MMDRVKQHLSARGVQFSELPNGDIFFRRSDGQGMYVRAFPDGTFDWCVNAARNDTNLMDFRPRESHRIEEVTSRIEHFLNLTVWGSIILDTLSLTHSLVDGGMPRAEAEEAVAAARNSALEWHQKGMDAREIRNRFVEECERFRRERMERGDVALQNSK